MQLQILSILITDDDGAEHLHEGIRLKNADDITAEREALRRSIQPDKQGMAFMQIKVWAACVRLGITKENFQTFKNRIEDYNLKLEDVDPTRLAGHTTSPSPSPESTAPSSSGLPEPTTT